MSSGTWNPANNYFSYSINETTMSLSGIGGFGGSAGTYYADVTLIYPDGSQDIRRINGVGSSTTTTSCKKPIKEWE